MLYLGLVASKDSHQAIAVTGSPTTLPNLGLKIADNRANMYVVQPDGGDVRYCVNFGTAAVGFGFIGNNQLYITMTRAEVYSTVWALAGTGASNLQVGSFIHNGFPMIF